MNAHSMSIVDVRCDAVHVGERHRKDLGEIAVLAASIAAEGLLQPIGITEENLLVFGERRLRAFQDVLRRETIPARVCACAASPPASTPRTRFGRTSRRRKGGYWPGFGG